MKILVLSYVEARMRVIADLVRERSAAFAEMERATGTPAFDACAERWNGLGARIRDMQKEAK